MPVTENVVIGEMYASAMDCNGDVLIVSSRNRYLRDINVNDVSSGYEGLTVVVDTDLKVGTRPLSGEDGLLVLADDLSVVSLHGVHITIESCRDVNEGSESTMRSPRAECDLMAVKVARTGSDD